MSIDSAEISVIVQGAIDWSIDQRMGEGRTLACTRMIRRLLPQAEIIVSTWDDAHVDGLTYDRLIQSSDPGSQGSLPGYTPSNVNRQIVSTLAGLGQATRPYCIKIRSDMILVGLDFIDIWARSPPLVSPIQLFDRPILANNLTSRNTSRILKRHPDHPLLFHPSDHFHFGNRVDLLKLWNIPLQSDEDSLFFVDMTQPNRWRYHELSRFTPEQHVLVSALQKITKLYMRDYADSNPALLALSEHVMQTHFKFIPDLQVPVHFEKYHTPHHFSFEWMRHAPMSFHDAAHEEPIPDTGLTSSYTVKHLWLDVTFPFRKPRAFRKWVKRKLVGLRGFRR